MSAAGGRDWFNDDDRERLLKAAEDMSDAEAAAYAVAARERRDQARAEGNRPVSLLLDEVLHALGERHLARVEWVRGMEESKP